MLSQLPSGGGSPSRRCCACRVALSVAALLAGLRRLVADAPARGRGRVRRWRRVRRRRGRAGVAAHGRLARPRGRGGVRALVRALRAARARRTSPPSRTRASSSSSTRTTTRTSRRSCARRIDDLPDLLLKALEQTSPVVISDNGRRRARLRALPGRHRRARQLPRPDRDLPRHAAARLRARPRAAARAGHAHRAPRARAPSGLGRAGRARLGL